MTAAERTLERSLALDGGVVVCSRAGSVVLATCDGCSFFCRTEAEPSSVICSYPIPARETFAFATRSRHSEAVRIALRHQLERTWAGPGPLASELISIGVGSPAAALHRYQLSHWRRAPDPKEAPS